MYAIALSLHIFTGALALISFWVAALGKKGTPWHKLVGKIFMLNMLVVTGSAVVLAGYFFASGKVGIGTFLSYLVILTVTAMSGAWRAIALKKDEAAFRNRNYQYLAWANIVSGLVVFVIGMQLKQSILMGFCWIGVVLGVQMLRRVKNPIGHARWWMSEHIGAVLGCGVATHIAFLSIGLKRILSMFGLTLSGAMNLLPWLAPVAVAVIASIWLERKYVSVPQRLAAERLQKANAAKALSAAS